ncbi:MAG: dodecin family protein [Acinetobacter sp.]
MSIAKVVEVNSSSNKSFEDAIQTGIAKVTETVKNVQGAWINEQKVVIKDNKITEYRVNLKLVSLLNKNILSFKNPVWGFL